MNLSFFHYNLSFISVTFSTWAGSLEIRWSNSVCLLCWIHCHTSFRNICLAIGWGFHSTHLDFCQLEGHRAFYVREAKWRTTMTPFQGQEKLLETSYGELRRWHQLEWLKLRESSIKAIHTFYWLQQLRKGNQLWKIQTGSAARLENESPYL